MHDLVFMARPAIRGLRTHEAVGSTTRGTPSHRSNQLCQASSQRLRRHDCVNRQKSAAESGELAGSDVQHSKQTAFTMSPAGSSLMKHRRYVGDRAARLILTAVLGKTVPTVVCDQLQRRGGLRLPAHAGQAWLIPDASAKVRSSRSTSPMGWKATSVTPCSASRSSLPGNSPR